jgi:hypothetical protein
LTEFFFGNIDCYPYCGCEPSIPWLFIRQPWAFISSIAYFISAWLIVRKSQRLQVPHHFWPVVLYLVGATSAVAHSNFSKLSMAMDFASIIFFITFLPVMDLFKRRALSLSIYYLALVLALLPFTLIGQFYFSMVMFLLGIQYFIRKRGIQMLKEGRVLFSLGLIGVSVIFMFLDKNEFFCQLEYVPYGHTIWHVGSAIGIYFFMDWYLHEEVERKT